jgi:hypothetical protein
MPEVIRSHAGICITQDVESPKKPPSKVIAFPDAQGAIEGTLDAWLPRLIEANEILTAALIRIRDLQVAGASNEILKEAVTALEAAAKAQTMV